MDTASIEILASLVAKQVLAQLEQEPAFQQKKCEEPCILCLGPADTICQETAVCGVDDYVAHRQILRYRHVVITELSLTQMTDLAMGRCGDDVTEAVLHALLSGVGVTLLERALPHRKYAGKGSPALYRLMEDYVRRIRDFGVTIAAEWKNHASCEPVALGRCSETGCATDGGSSGCAVVRDKLITEKDALRLIRENKEIAIAADTILTPSARDVFFQAGCRIVQKEEKCAP